MARDFAKQNLYEQDYLSDPEGIINLDESGFIVGFEQEKVYAQKGKKLVHSDRTCSIMLP
ncbi:hypothetical protein RvY_04499 [Ramazzottius varieornatus]|uniref:Uncharacterized protein n=1 Tax=Ramazzottius varieornatus TaxID=947166 RepID=A0A1D1URT8_RAMVA|nr:hypothetical protein RvY_04499 [Ramazzottius varieornatus]